MEIEYITTTEEMVLNPDYKGLRVARIEVFVEGEHFPKEVGRIKIWNGQLLPALAGSLSGQGCQ
jgi:hypothetical protein